MVFRATFVAVRAASFLAALLVFLFAQLFLPGAPFGPPGPEPEGATGVAASAAYSVCAGLGTFLFLFGAWTYRVQALVVRMAIARLFLARLALGLLLLASAAVIAACLAWPGFARMSLIVGSVASAVALLGAFIVKGRAPRRRAAWAP